MGWAASRLKLLRLRTLNRRPILPEPPESSNCRHCQILIVVCHSYAIKFKVKKGTLGIDYGVMPLEGLWESDDMPNFNIAEKSRWKWTVMIMQPSFVTQDLVEQVLKEVKEKKNPAALPKLRWESFSEGRCAQIMHIGPFSEEGPTVQKVHRFIDTIGKRVRKHHEIYLSDIRKAAPATWKTVIRQPLR